ncbi:MAG: hypothetical protein E7430_10390 [Ruminococcaceae bacterium]|nr:hypothetical protein [Oscillospiraceae bacterium]
MKKQASPLLWLLLIPGQLIVGILFVFVGTRIDLALFSGSGYGHGIPIFSVIFLLIAAVVTLIVVVLSIVLVIRGYRKRCK